MQPFVLHAHFYQPERLNPWTGALDPEPSAAPDRDWNERILRQCYRPNGSARIFDGSRRVEQIVNNYERLSFNFGPTLLTWMERHDPQTYARIVDGDWRSSVRLGHGNAMAQAYNHMILPLANARDRRTQVLWGLADFRHRFTREAEGMWLPETACNREVVDTLIDAGVRFTVLAPYQADRVRFAGGRWQPAGGALDLGRAYRHAHSDGSGRHLAVFFYDGGLAQGMAFDPATADAGVLLERLQQARPAGGGLTSAALDGETFGHHHPFGELGLAYALFTAAERRGMAPTNYGAWLEANPPVDDVEVVAGEGTAWSCAHGVGRWYRDCGCSTDSLPDWNQAWRTPLRQALDMVRDAAAAVFEERGAELLRDPWAARDRYIDVRLGRVGRAEFLDAVAVRNLPDDRTVDLWTLLESQRNAMIMYTSCGWFFADISGIETVYVLRYAARALDLLGELGAPVPRDTVLDILATAPSNKPGVGTGADVWREQVDTAVVTPRRVAAHTALRGLVRQLPARDETGGSVVTLTDHRRDQRERLGLSTARMVVTSNGTGRRHDYFVAALHLGGLDFHGVVSEYPGAQAYAAAVTRLWEAFPTAPLARLLQLVNELIAGEEFGLGAALPEGRQEVVGAIFSELNERFTEQYARLFHDHRRELEMLTAAGYTLPRDLRAAAELTLSAELEQHLRAAAVAATRPEAFTGIRATLEQARSQGYQLDLAPVEAALTTAVARAACAAARTLTPADVDAIRRWVTLSAEIGVDLDLTGPQECVYEVAVRARAGRLSASEIDVVAGLGRLLGLSPVAWSAPTPEGLRG